MGGNMSEEAFIESAEINGNLYFKNGEIAPTVQYTGGHPKATKQELLLHGNTYEI